MIVEVSKDGRARIEEGNELKIEIPSKMRIFITIFMMAWLGGWLFGEVFAVSQILFGNAPEGVDFFLIFWLIGWTVGGGFVIYNVLWNIAGKEILIITKSVVLLERKVFNIGITKQYDLNHVKNIRVTEEDFFSNTWGRSNIWGKMRGKIAFDFGMKTINFAGGIDDAEANYLIEKIKSRVVAK